MNTILPYFQTNKNLAYCLAKMAIRALYFEVKAYPKPGLVSFIDAGAHVDMNGETFYRSLFTLRHYFQQLVCLSQTEFTFEPFKQLAIKAELGMLSKTAGINTHRGAIFALGLCCVSVARLINEKTNFTSFQLQAKLISDWQPFLALLPANPNSHGAIVAQQYNIVDAKQMAMHGYTIVFELLPSFIALYSETKSLNITCLFAYLELLLKMDDTNVLYRAGYEGLAFAKDKANDLLAISCHKKRQQQALLTHQEFSAVGISPGGVADMIGVLLFFGQIFCEQLRCHY